MNFSDMLGYADIGQLSRIAEVYRCECNGNSKNELIQSILSTVSRHDVFDEQISQMKLEELRFLNSLLFETRESYSLEDLVARVQQSRYGNDEEEQKEPSAGKKTVRSRKAAAMANQAPSPREVIARFKHHGWLFNGFSGPNRYLFQVPHDLKLRFRETLRRRFVQQLQYTDEPPLYRDEQGLMIGDVKSALHFIRHNDIQLMADGSMYKRFLLQLIDRMGVSEEMPSKGAWRFGYGRHFNHYPDRFSFLYDYCFHCKYISEQEELLSVTDRGLERLEGAPSDEADQMFHYWLKLYRTPIANVSALVHWIQAFSEEWVTVDSLRKVLAPFIKPYFYDDAKSILEGRILTMMMHLGLIRIGEHQSFGTVVRMTKAGNKLVAGNSLQLR
ncbi:hypothetical protein [Paenibacillus sp. HB172176]|uniref:hypothetical protein n=1 Tax=Paenibacillus sp. HB172176 TaxID=2493690 RepID=UPI00143B5E61|nr:hypothetical protein [Paenibacillus sp. HB172176]